MASKRKPQQPLLGIVARPKPVRKFVDRGFGVEETPWQKQARLARERALHEQTKQTASAADVLANVKLRRMK